ncbi:glutaredoxin domain-containing protein [Gordonia sp. VNK1]|uniref:glutaredoxin family protein n=1 Tax=Gordonia oleivorans TaxID=3156618 RepID=UPI0032B5AB65
MRTTTPEIIVLTQPNCGACKFVEKSIDAAGLDASYRDVREDADAAEMLVELFAAHKPGEHPRTPVAVVDGTPYFGTAVRDALRSRGRAAA